MVDAQLTEVLNQLINMVMGLGVLFAVFMLGVAGLRTLGGDGNAWREGIRNTVQGLILVLGARTLVWIVEVVVTQAISAVKP